jgi:hypothetical protein
MENSSRPVAFLKGARLERSNRQLKARNNDSNYYVDHTLEAVAAPSKVMNRSFGRSECCSCMG